VLIYHTCNLSKPKPKTNQRLRNGYYDEFTRRERVDKTVIRRRGMIQKNHNNAL